MVEFRSIPYFVKLQWTLGSFQGNNPISVSINKGTVSYSDSVRLPEALNGFELTWVAADVFGSTGIEDPLRFGQRGGVGKVNGGCC